MGAGWAAAVTAAIGSGGTRRTNAAVGPVGPHDEGEVWQRTSRVGSAAPAEKVKRVEERSSWPAWLHGRRWRR